MSDSGVNNCLDLCSAFSPKDLKTLHTSTLTILLNREKRPSLLPQCGLWSLYSSELVKSAITMRAALLAVRMYYQAVCRETHTEGAKQRKKRWACLSTLLYLNIE